MIIKGSLEDTSKLRRVEMSCQLESDMNEMSCQCESEINEIQMSRQLESGSMRWHVTWWCDG